MAIIYNVYENDQMIYSGTERQVQRKFGLSQNTRLGFYSKTGSYMRGKYTIKREKPITIINYNFYENGALVFTGTSREFQEFANIRLVGSVAPYASSNSLIRGRWIAKRVGSAPKKDKKVEYLLEHLKKYGNTVFNKDPKDYKKILAELGCPFKARKVKLGGSIGRQNVCWILERV